MKHNDTFVIKHEYLGLCSQKQLIENIVKIELNAFLTPDDFSIIPTKKQKTVKEIAYVRPKAESSKTLGIICKIKP